MRLRALLPVIILGVSAAGAVALMQTRPGNPPIAREEQAWLVETMAVAPASHAPTLLLYGRVETPRSARLTAAISAEVVAVEVLEGERVAAGRVLVRLDDRDAQLLLRQREAELAELAAEVELEEQAFSNDREALEREGRVLQLARRAVERAEELARTNVGSRSQLDGARQEAEQRSMSVDARRTAIAGHASRMRRLQARVARAEALRDAARLDVARALVRAPFAGPVASVQVSPGDRVQPGAALLTVFDSAALELRAQIPTRHLPAMRAALASGAAVTASGSVGGQAVAARLERIGAQVARASGGVDALFGILGDSSDLPLGLTVELNATLGREDDSIALPPQALYGDEYVYRVVDGRMQRVAVRRIGEQRTRLGTQVLVRSTGLARGDRVVITQLPNAVDGLRVRVSTAPASGD